MTRVVSRGRKAFSYGLLVFGLGTLMSLDQFDLILNASDSLPDTAYVMLDYPVMLERGAVVATEMPDVLASQYAEHVYVKRIYGMPGDAIAIRADGATCIGEMCFTPQLHDGAPVGPALDPQTIPDKHYAVFGETRDSLDSRYKAIGLISEEDIVGRAWALPWFPHWKDLDEWF